MSERTLLDGRLGAEARAAASGAEARSGGGPVAVVGAGSIGVAWAIVFARAGSPVVLYDPDAGRRELAGGELARRLAALSQAGLLDEVPAALSGRVTVTGDLASAVSRAAYVQECAPESLELKQELFGQLDGLAAAGVPLASSSSALAISTITAGLRGTGRCLVAHPGNPPYLLPIVELVPGPATSAGIVTGVKARLQAAGMTPVVLGREIEGFVFNRLQGAVLREAYRLVRDGVVTPAGIDSVMRDGLGRRWAVLGPFETAELNIRGGIEVHAERMGPAYRRMGAAHGEDDPWTDELVAEVASALQQRFPRRLWEESVEWRDRVLMAFEALRRSNPWLAAPPGARLDTPAPESG